MNTENKLLLKSRAKALASEVKHNFEKHECLDLLTFSLSSEMYGIESSFVREVYPMKDFTALPGLPSYVLGLIQVRRQIIDVINLKEFFNLPTMGLGELNKVIILQNEQMEFGILADVVFGTRIIEKKDIKPAPSAVSGIGEEYMLGVTKEELIVLNASALLSDKRIIVNDVDYNRYK